ncbi:MAG: hypothetical protein FWD17_08480 [Polyangiaceae bacterium]|nr:hypothetical protein [Polyangiaceae bacterium]
MKTKRRTCRPDCAWIANVAGAMVAGPALAACGSEPASAPTRPPPPSVGTVNVIPAAAGCAKLSSWAILPSEVNVGSSVDLLATASVVPGENIAFTWASDGGVAIANPHAAHATAVCSAPGTFAITVSVADADAADAGCGDMGTGHVQCDSDGGMP